MAEKIHLTYSNERDTTYCSWNDHKTLTHTSNVMEVTCRACLKAVAPERTLDELRELAQKVLTK